MDWENPYWAGFTVIFCSLSSAGQSLGKAGLRLLGTCAAAVVTFLLMSVLPQLMWVFMLTISLYIFFCAYMSTGKFIPYFFRIAGYVSLLMCLKGGMDSQVTFDTTVLRIEQTGLGVMVMTMVNLLIWPELSSGKIVHIAEELFRSLQAQYRESYNAIVYNRVAKTQAKLHLEFRVKFAEFSTELAGSSIDTPEIFARRDRWVYLQNTLAKFFAELEVLRETANDLRGLRRVEGEEDPETIKAVLKHIEEVDRVLNERFAYLFRRCVEDIPPPEFPDIVVEVDTVEFERYPVGEKALIAMIKQRLNKLCRLSANIVECMANRKETYFIDTSISRRLKLPVIDRERLIPAIRVIMTLWIAFIASLYLPLPGEINFVILATNFSMAFLTSPKIPVKTLIKPFCYAIVIASVLYIFVLPYMTRFLSLGALIFGFAFLVSYYFGKSGDQINKTFALGITLAVLSISNPQQHDLMQLLTMSMMFAFIVMFLMFMAFLPESMHPGNVSYSLLRRFWRNACSSSQDLFVPLKSGIISRWLSDASNFYVENIPEKLGEWLPAIDLKKFPELRGEDLEDIGDSVRTISIHLHKIVLLRELIDSSKLMALLSEEYYAYAAGLSSEFAVLAKKQAYCADNEYNRLYTLRKDLNAQIEKKLCRYGRENTVNHVEVERIYRLLGHHNTIVSALRRYLRIVEASNIKVLSEFRL